jgi:iron(III) transport system substrate-binding protein
VRSSEKNFETLQLGAFATSGLLLAPGPKSLTAESEMNKVMPPPTLKIPVLGLIFVLCAVFPRDFVLAQDNATAKLIEGAKKEGKMVFYSSLNIEDNNGLLKKFEEKYPFIKTELNRLSADRLLIRFQSEARAKKHAADVLLNGGARTYITKKEGLLMKYVSPESKFYGPGFKDPDGYWTDAYLNAHVLVYNTRMLKAQEVLRSHADLLQPQWKGKFAMVSKAYEWFLKYLKVTGEEQGLQFFKRLAQQKPEFRIGSSQVADLVAAGEHPIGINTYSTNVEDLKTRSAPVEWVPLDPVIATLHPIAVSAQAPHPNAAKLFVDYVLSKEGMTLLRSFKRIPSRLDVEPSVPRLTKGIKFHAAEPELAEEFDKYARTFQNIFEIR